MRVVLAGPYPLLDPVRIDGGVEAAAFYLAQGLKVQEGIDLHVVSSTKRVQVPTEACDGAIAVHYLPASRRRIIPNMITEIFRLRGSLDALRPDIVHGQTSPGALAGLMGDHPTVCTIHGVMHREGVYYGNRPADRLNARLSRYLAEKAISGASHSIAVSSYVRDEYRDIARSGISVIPNAVDEAFFDVAGEEVPDRILYVGFIGTRKNILGLIRAFEIVKRSRLGAELAVAGGVRDQAYFADIREYVEAHGLSGSVHFLGLLNQDDLLREHAKAAVVCTFSWHETFSLTVAQGMAAGKPAVSSDSGGPSDLIVQGESGFLVAPGDETAFADSLIALLDDSDLRRGFGLRSREIANERFRKEVVAAQTLRVYEEVLSAVGPVRSQEMCRR